MYKEKTEEEPKKSLSRFQVILMSVAAGVAVANIYYNQPILTEISASLNINETSAGFISILSQVGYGLGLFFITPLGDKINKKKLIVVL
ncbi:MAG TPA: MFS transporter, partial [Ruminiclostridium sp.]|nr:MFS transporter [Ruminiclostridium sp.]